VVVLEQRIRGSLKWYALYKFTFYLHTYLLTYLPLINSIRLNSLCRQTPYVGPVFHPPPSKHHPTHHHQQQQQARERQSQTQTDGGDSSAPLERRPARRTNPATVNVAAGPENNDAARPTSYQGDYHVTSYARPRILLIRSNTDRTSQQVRRPIYIRRESRGNTRHDLCRNKIATTVYNVNSTPKLLSDKSRGLDEIIT